MFRRRIVCLALAMIMLLACAACGGTTPPAPSSTAPPAATPAVTPGTSAAPTEVDKSDWIKLDLTLASYIPESDSVKQIVAAMTESLQEAMPGLVTLTGYYSAALLSQADMYDGILAGTADIGYIDLGSVAGSFPYTGIWGYPSLLVESQVGATAAYNEWVQQTNPEDFKDVVFLFGQCMGPSTFLTTFELDDVGKLVGKQIRATSILSKTLLELGANPISMATGEVYEALRNGMLEGAFASFGSMAIYKFTDIASYGTMVPLGTTVMCYAMNKDVFNSMPESQQEAFMDAIYAAVWEKIIPNYEYINTLCVDAITSGAAVVDWTFTNPDGELYKELSEGCASLLTTYLAELDGQGRDGTGQLAEIQSYLDKWCAGWWDFERHIEPFEALGSGTYDTWYGNYKIPENMPAPAARK